jgi:hypothetical protein
MPLSLGVRVHALVCLGAARVASAILTPVLEEGRDSGEAGARGASTVAEVRANLTAPGSDAAAALAYSRDRCPFAFFLKQLLKNRKT